MTDFVIIKIHRSPGYEGVSPELLLDDFLETPREFDVELVLEEGDE